LGWERPRPQTPPLVGKAMDQQPIGGDEEAAALASALSALDRELMERREQHSALRAQLHMLASQLKSERAIASDLAWELEDLEQRMRDLAEQRGGPVDPLLERELTSITQRRAALEEQVLAQLMRVDELLARKDAAEQSLAAEERAWAIREAELRAERERLAQLLANRSGRLKEQARN
jgi:DNA repair exonuclease SbcCD ATPase subunit